MSKLYGFIFWLIIILLVKLVIYTIKKVIEYDYKTSYYKEDVNEIN